MCSPTLAPLNSFGHSFTFLIAITHTTEGAQATSRFTQKAKARTSTDETAE